MGLNGNVKTRDRINFSLSPSLPLFFFLDISYNIAENITGGSSRRLTFGDGRSAVTRTLRFSNQRTASDTVTVYANVSGC